MKRLSKANRYNEKQLTFITSNIDAEITEQVFQAGMDLANIAKLVYKRINLDYNIKALQVKNKALLFISKL